MLTVIIADNRLLEASWMVSGSGKPEISCRVINSLIRYAESRGVDIDAILAGSGVSKLYLTDPNNWVSNEFKMDFCEHLAQHLGEEDIMYKAALLTPATNVLGGIELLVRLLGSPRPCYSMIPEYSKYFERISEFTVQFKGRNSALVTMRPTMVHPKSKHACHYARGILAAIPTVWRLPPATVLEKRCSVPVDRAGTIGGKYYRVAKDGTVLQFEPQAHDVPEHGQAVGKLDEHGTFEVGGITYGAEACVYEVSWTEPRPWYRRIMEFFVGPRSFLKEEITELERDKKLLQEKCEEVLRLSQ